MTFEEFQKIYQPGTATPTEVLSAEAAMKKIWEHEKKFRGIDWLTVQKNGPDALRGAVAQAQAWLAEQAGKLSETEKQTAREMGWLDSSGNVHDISAAFFDTYSAGDLKPAKFPDGAPSYTVWGWNQETVNKYKAARGNDVKKYISNLVQNFQVMEQSDDVGITKICMDAGIWGFGTLGVVAAFNIIKTLVQLTQATEAYAVLEGIITVGVNVIRLGISIVILAIIVPLMILMAKDALGLFVIINDTPSNLVMSGTHFTHGKCIAGFKENAAADNQQAIIPAIYEVYNPDARESRKAISAGFLGVRKRDDALIGTQGAISFAATKEFASGIFLGWEVPLSIGSNKLLVSASYTGSASGFSGKTDDNGELNSTDKSQAGYTIEGHMNSKSGSEAYAFYTASKS